jgi:SAM-dependent methyltransferase
MSPLKALLKPLVPERWRRFLRVHAKRVWPPIGLVRFGGLRRLTPVSARFGERGQPIDRYYVERFLRRQSGQEDYVLGDIRGHTLEIGDDFYSRMFGLWGTPGSTVDRLDVLSADAAAPEATIVGDLVAAEHVPSDTFDCIICTQTLMLIYDVRAAIATLHRILKPGGVLLATVPGISPSCRPDINLWGDHWRFTSLSTRRLFEERFDPADVTVEAHGNVLAAVAFMHRLGSEELRASELDLNDPDFELVITVRAQKQRG